MNMIERLAEPLQWSEGMMLSPQHFQQNDIYWHQMLCHQMSQLQPYYWGLLDIQLNTEEIKQGKLGITQFHGVMPDGLVVQFPAQGQEETLSIDISKNENMQADGNTIKVFATVPIRKDASASPNSDIRRYHPVNSEMVLDENTGLGRMEIRRLRPLVQLFVGQKDEIPAKYHAMPLFELRRTNGSFEFTSYHPPLLRLSASRFLGKRSLQSNLSSLVNRVHDKAHALAGVKDSSQTSAMPINHRYRTIIHSLVCALPPLEVLVDSGEAHPFSLYQAIAALDGNIAVIGGNVLPLRPERYNHNNITPGFHKLLHHISQTVKGLHLAYNSQHFSHNKMNAEFSIVLDKDINTSYIDIELRPRQGQSPRDVANWLRQSRIASNVVIDELKKRRQGGATVGSIPKEQVSGMDVSSTSLLFRLSNLEVNINSQVRKVIQAGKTLIIEGGNVDDAPESIVLQIPNERRS